jgi:hypothetical protein
MSVVWTYDGGPPDIRSANSIPDIRGTTGRTLLFEYPLDNTWTYETSSEPMYKDHRTYAKVAERPLLCQGVGGELSL